MKIGLLDIDSHNFPNLALMKLSSHHKSIGDDVEWVNHFNQYDIVYKSKVFTFSQDNGHVINSNRIIQGGTGYDPLIKLDPKIENTIPDYSLYPMFKSGYGFLTRGCPRKCEWCIVPKKEGDIYGVADIGDILQGRKSAILMDNNVLASEHGIKQIEKIIKLKIKVDFNQGLDARLIDRPMAKLLSQVKWLSPLRMSCDSDFMLKMVLKAMRYLREADCTPSRYFVYVMMQDPQIALKRINLLDKKGMDPFTQAYIDYSGRYTVTKTQERLMRWCNRKEIMRSCKFENYK
jgi:hypothetical protein